MGFIIGEAHELGVEANQAQQFYKEYWERSIALEDSTFYKWQFCSSPTSLGLDRSIVAVDEDTGQLGAIMGLNPGTFCFHHDQRNGAELTTWISRPDIKGKGIAPKIISFIQSKYDVFIGMGISADALPVYLRLGAKYIRAIPRYFKIINPDAADNIGTITPLARKLIKSSAPKSVDKALKSTYASLDDIIGVCDNHKNNYFCFARDDSYVKWRFSDHPYYDYKLFSIWSSAHEVSTVVIVRSTHVKGIGSIIHIVDLLGYCSKEVIDAIQVLIQEEFRDVIAIDIFCTTEKLCSHLRNSDWFSSIDHQSFVEFPHLFSPVELRNPATTSLIFWSSQDLDKLTDMCKLYISGSDCDLDRPTLHSTEMGS